MRKRSLLPHLWRTLISLPVAPLFPHIERELASVRCEQERLRGAIESLHR